MWQKTSDLGSAERPSRNGGFTLLELMITGSILAIAACGMAAVMVNSMVLTSVNKETATAREAARQVLEQIEDIPAHEVFYLFGGGPPPPPPEGEEPKMSDPTLLQPPPLIEGGNLTAFGVRLPLSRGGRLPDSFGTRHHAALGLSQATDALVLVVSEERRAVNAFAGGRRFPMDSEEQVVRRIHEHWEETVRGGPLSRAAAGRRFASWL